MKRLLDLFCGGGGCTKGYQNAGFYVVGVDINPQPRYCGDEFYQDDAIEYVKKYGHLFDAIHASPPCQEYTKSAKQWRLNGNKYPDLISKTRDILIKSGKPYVIENVPNSPLINPIILNGSLFGLLVHRPRLFECSFHIKQPNIPKTKQPIKMGRPIKDGDIIQPVGHFSNVGYAREQMGIDWLVRDELSQAIPPAYTEFIGKELMKILW